MKRKIIALCLVVAFLFSIASCSSSSQDETEKRRTRRTTAEVTTEESELPTKTSEPAPTTSEPFYSEAPYIPEKDTPRFQYDMDLVLDDTDRTIGGHVTLNFFNTSDDDWDRLCFRDYSSVFSTPSVYGYTCPATEVTDITNMRIADSDESLSITREAEDASVVWVELPNQLAPGESMTIEYDFTANVPEFGDRYGYAVGVYSLANFYPILAVYDDDGWSHNSYYSTGECFYSEMSDYDVTMTCPEGYVLASSGVVKAMDEVDGEYVYEVEADNVRDFTMVTSQDFEVMETDYDGTHIQVFYFGKNGLDCEDENYLAYNGMGAEDDATVAIEASRMSLAAFNPVYGKYPYSELDVILMPLNAGGMEYPNLIMIDISCADYHEMPITETDAYEYYDNYAVTVIAHEIAHQWFMGIVGEDSYEEAWLDESMASFSETIFWEAYLTEDAMDEVNSFDSLNLDYSSDSMYFPINQAFGDYESDYHFVYGIYYVGRWVIFDIREAMGRDTFNQMILEYVQTYAYTNVTTEDYINLIYEYGGHDNEELNEIIDRCFDL